MKAELRAQDSVDRKEWEAFLKASPQGAFFAQPGFMDIVAPGWQAVELREDGKLVALMPLNLRKKAGMLYSLQPPFAQYWGIFFAPQSEGNPYKAYSWKRKAILSILEKLPKGIRLFRHTFAPEFDYATPFHWQGYTLTTRYTYRLPVEGSPDELMESLNKDKRGEIRQALKSGIVVAETQDFSALFGLAMQNQAEGKAVIGNAGMPAFKHLTEYLCKGRGGYVLEARMEGQVVAAGLFVFDGAKTVYLAGVQDPAMRKLGAMNPLLWAAITRDTGPGRMFDFEGSMMEPVEAFFRGFGAVPVPYLFIQKNRLPLLVRWIRNSQ